MAVRILQCLQCSHTWVTGRTIDYCPKCGSHDWNKPKQGTSSKIVR
jgi:Zn finger protein HypA/HybF involved in hydrogenase expression